MSLSISPDGSLQEVFEAGDPPLAGALSCGESGASCVCSLSDDMLCDSWVVNSTYSDYGMLREETGAHDMAKDCPRVVQGSETAGDTTTVHQNIKMTQTQGNLSLEKLQETSGTTGLLMTEKLGSTHSDTAKSNEKTLENNEHLTAIFSELSPMGTIVNVYQDCVNGNCKCTYLIGNVRSQLKPCRFASLILNESAGLRDKYVELLWGVTDGFPIVDSTPQTYECENYNSITAPGPSEKMTNILLKELKEGFVTKVEEKPVCIHSLGAVPKGDNGIRNITDCSRPVGISVNYHCDSLLENFCFKSVEDVVDLLGPGDYMSVIDIKAAYRAVPIREAHRKFQGFSWELEDNKCWFVDNRLCFGLRLGPKYFNYISNFVYDVLTELYGLNVVNYLDDFIAVAPSMSDCNVARDKVVGMLRFLGFHVAYEKLVSPSQIVTYLGIVIDSLRMELRLPDGKLTKLTDLVGNIEGKNRVSKKDLQILGGLLSHCSHIVKGGKIFCKNVYKLYKEMVNKNLRYVNLTTEVKDDLRWWKRFCKFFNGSMRIVEDAHDHPMVSDSSLKGFAVYMNDDWVAGVWDDNDYINVVSPCSHVGSRPLMENFEKDNINVLELWPIVVGLKRWANLLKNKSLDVFTDNTQVMFMLLNGGSVNKCCCNWLREIFWLTAIYNIKLTPKYINTKSNLVADTLSRVIYPATASKIVEYLYGSNLCCLDLLFESCRASQPGGSRREIIPVPSLFLE